MMVRSGDVIENPVVGDRFIFRKTAQDTGGELLEFEMIAKPSAVGPPAHIHPNSEESFRVLTGSLQMRVEGQNYFLGEGDEYVVQRGTPHTWWNNGNADARVLVQFRPALRLENFLETVCALAKAGKTNAKGLPNPLQLAVFVSAYFDVAYLASPPLAIQKVVFGVLGPIGRLRGYRADFPYPAEKAGSPS